MSRIYEITDFSAPEGQGLCARLDGETVWGGNARLAAAMDCDISALSAAAEELAAKGARRFTLVPVPPRWGLSPLPIRPVRPAPPPLPPCGRWGFPCCC